MPNHPNRSRRAPHPARNPAPEAIRAARRALGLTQKQAAESVHSTLRTWQAWEQGDRRMHPAIGHLFQLLHATPPDARITACAVCRSVR